MLATPDVRRPVRARIGEERFVQVTTLIAEAEQAESAIAYDAPKQSAMTLCVAELGADEAARRVEEELRGRGLLSSDLPAA